MNIKGIELLRKLNLSAPKKELISRDLFSVDLDWLYDGALHGATILVFDSNEPINQNPLLEKNVRKYKIKRVNYFDVLNDLIKDLKNKGVRKKDMVFLTHQTYLPDDISFSGRVAINANKDGFGELLIDAVESLRKANTDFDSTFVYRCPIVGGRVFSSRGKVEKHGFNLPHKIITKLIKDILKIPGNPNIDFEVYSGEDKVFYHDMFLAH